MMLALMVGMFWSANLFAEDKIVDLEAEMFKSWSSPDADAVPTEETAVAEDGECSATLALYEELSAGSLVYGHSNVYYLWYADVTGTKTIYFEGTAGLQLRVLMNRPVPEEGGDAHGGATTEKTLTLGDDGKGSLDVTDLPYVHINAIKLGWGSPTGTLKKIQLEGTVKSVSGWVDMLNNSDLATDDLESFPVSKDGPNNGDSANDRPTIVEDDGVRVMKVTADDLTSAGDSWTTWSTQFFLKLNEALGEGVQWRMELDCKASENATVTTSAQGNPRAWHANFVEGFDVYTGWNHFEWEGTVTADQAGEDGLGSIAFDLNNSAKPIDFFFKNVHFYIYKEKSPLAQISAGFSYDVICINLGKMTNMDQLVEAAGGKRVIYPKDCASVKVNGNATTLLSVEGKTDGRLFVFVDEGYSEDEDDVVEVSFTNPADPAYHLQFITGRWEGEDVPSFTDMVATYQYELGEEFSYLSDTPTLVSADPEDGSFNLPLSLKTFKLTFDNPVDCSALEAYLDKTQLTVAPNSGLSADVTLTLDGDITAGEHTLRITKIYPESPLADDIFGEETLTLNFGKVDIDPNDQPREVLPVSYFNDCAEGGIPAGYIVYFGSEERLAGNSYGSGARVFAFGDGGDFSRGLYFRDQHVEYGTIGGYELPLEAGKKYNIHFNTAAWKDSGFNILFEIVSPTSGEAVFSELVTTECNVNGSKNAVKGSTVFDIKYVPEETGNFILKWTPADASGNASSWAEALLANVYVKYVPNVVGVEETQLLLTALENAKAVRDGNADERYEGAELEALKALIGKIEAEMEAYTAPSVYKSAAASLDEAAEAVKNHHTQCDTYDANIKKAIDIHRQNAAKIFAQTAAYEDLAVIVAKYHGASQWVNVAAEGEEENWQLSYEYDVLKDNAALTAANAELGAIIEYTSGMFTEGPSKCNMTGYAVLTERLRLGVEALKSLGVAADDALIVAAEATLDDDDELADAIKNRLRKLVYAQLKEADNTLFETQVDPESMVETAPTYDMTVFVKNPNIYRVRKTGTFSTEAVPGWTSTAGNPQVTTGWSDVGSDVIPADGMVSNWISSFKVSQVVKELPVGVYTIVASFGERTDEEGATEGSYFFVADSKNDTIMVDAPVIGQSYPVDNLTLTDVPVVDGQLEIGVAAGPNSHVFFNQVKVLMAGAVSDFDYGQAYTDGIAAAELSSLKVRAIELYDLNGRRLTSAPSGVFIVRKLMSDGTVQTEKRVRK